MELLQEVNLTSKATNAGAEIILVEKGDDLNVYVSSRGVGIIEVFKMDGKTNKVVRVQEFLLAGTWPRHMTIHPSGTLLAVGDQKGNSVQLVRIQPTNCLLILFILAALPHYTLTKPNSTG